MLNLLRIKAETHVLHWHSLENYISDQMSFNQRVIGSYDHSVEDERHGSCSMNNDTKDGSTPDADGSTPDADGATPDKTILYLKSACEMVRKRSSETAVIFLYLPKPPRIQNSTKEEHYRKAENYLTNLEELTNHWPPTLLVRGVSPVTSTTL